MGRRERERELKFSPGPGFRVDEAIAGVDAVRAGDPEVRTLHATYYDTADLRLARAGSSLRWRDDQGWMVKLPAAGGGDGLLARDELAVAGAPGAPPAEALELVTSLTRGAPIEAVAELVTVRNRVDLFDADGAPLAELVDDEVSVLHHGERTTRFREVELELAADAHAERAAGIVDALAAGAGEPDPVPKIVRALGPRAAGPPDLLPPITLDEASTPAEVLRAAVARSTLRLVTHDPGVRLGIDAEDVHQARVATRRLRSDLRTFRAVVDPDWDATLRAELEWLGNLLGAVRDTDVLLDRLERRLATLDDADADAGHPLLGGLHSTRDAARVELLGALRSRRYIALLDLMYEASRRIPGPPDASDLDVELADVARRPWRQLRRAADALTDDSPDPELHRVRILAKRCRYAAEAVAPALGPDAAKFASHVADLQDVLGEHQDAVIAGRWLRQHARSAASVEAAFVAGELAMLELVAAEASRELWPGAWRSARARRLHCWM